MRVELFIDLFESLLFCLDGFLQLSGLFLGLDQSLGLLHELFLRDLESGLGLVQLVVWMEKNVNFLAPGTCFAMQVVIYNIKNSAFGCERETSECSVGE